MAMQALPVVVWLTQLDIFGSRFFSQVVHIEMAKSAKFCLERSKHSVVGVTCVAGLVLRDAMVLKVGGSKIRWIVHVKAFAIRFHDVARETKPRALGTFHLAVHSRDETKNGEKK